MNRFRSRLLAALCAGLLVTGCGAAPGIERPTPAPISASASGLSLRGAGFNHAPAGFTIPGEVSITRRVDQPNVITALFSTSDGRLVLDHLTSQLPAMGFVIDRSGGDSLMFSNQQWEGALTISPEISGLTLRRKPG